MTTPRTPIKLGSHTFKEFDPPGAFLWATIMDFPLAKEVPPEHASGQSDQCKLAERMFVDGSTLQDNGLKLKNSAERDFTGRFLALYQALALAQHVPGPVKVATLGWLLAEYTQPITKSVG